MSMPHNLQFVLVGLFSFGLTTMCFSSVEGADGTSLSIIEIVERLENEGYGPFTELSMDNGLWEIEARKQGESVEVKVDPISGKILSEHRDDPETAPPATAMKLSKLLRTVAGNSKYKRFNEVSFERRYWEIELLHNGEQRELHVDPRTGNIIADRLDD